MRIPAACILAGLLLTILVAEARAWSGQDLKSGQPVAVTGNGPVKAGTVVRYGEPGRAGGSAVVTGAERRGRDVEMRAWDQEEDETLLFSVQDPENEAGLPLESPVYGPRQDDAPGADSSDRQNLGGPQELLGPADEPLGGSGDPNYYGF